MLVEGSAPEVVAAGGVSVVSVEPAGEMPAYRARVRIASPGIHRLEAAVPRFGLQGRDQPGADRPGAPRPAHLLGRPACRAGTDRLRRRLRPPPLRLRPPRGGTAGLLAPGERPSRQPGPLGADTPRDGRGQRGGAFRRLPRVRVERRHAGGRRPQRHLPRGRAAPAAVGTVLHRGRARPGARPGDGAGVSRGHEGRRRAHQHARRRQAHESGFPRAAHRDPRRGPLHPRHFGLVRPRRPAPRLPRGASPPGPTASPAGPGATIPAAG